LNGKAKYSAQDKQHKGIDSFLDFPVKTTELNLSLCIEVAVFEKHIEPYSINPVHWRFFIADQQLNS
jgi:hypothetical protein